jgi:cobalt/nickel transport system permease protein
MIEESFSDGDSLIHRMDPRLKVISAILYAFIVALSFRFTTLFTALGFSLLLIVLARLNAQKVAKRLAVVNGLIFFFWFVLPLTFEGKPLFYLGPLAVTREGVILSAQITLKSNAILLAFIPLIASMSIATLGHTMNRLNIPNKIVHLFLLTYRYIFVIYQEYQRLSRSAKIRGFRPGTNAHTYRTYAYLIGMLFVRASARAQRVHQAMLCRGFKGKFYCLHKFSMSLFDWTGAVIMAVAFFILGSMEWTKIA